jgi:hypothetical protein
MSSALGKHRGEEEPASLQPMEAGEVVVDGRCGEHIKVRE